MCLSLTTFRLLEAKNLKDLHIVLKQQELNGFVCWKKTKVDIPLIDLAYQTD